MSYESIKNELLSHFPLLLRREIELRYKGSGRISEIRIRRSGRCSLLCKTAVLPLLYSAKDSIDEIFLSICHGTPYAYRYSIAEGFIAMPSGVRVGVVGRANYEGGELVGISNISSLVFRIPTDECSFADELYEIWKRRNGGVLLFSPPGRGKTTALRSLAGRLASGVGAMRVAIVDEREEIFTEALYGLEIDVLSGYKRALGISIATRTLNPEVIVIDEIASEDAPLVLASSNSGVPIIASAHAENIDELSRRADLMKLVEARVFGTFVEIGVRRNEYFCKEAFLDFGRL